MEIILIKYMTYELNVLKTKKRPLRLVLFERMTFHA